jgi:TolB-like protein/DNA-binding SARP family transcriptional activator
VNRLTLFGGAVLDAESGPITGRAAQRHRVALLALLSTTRRLHRRRDQLVSLLWPDADAERGRKLLSDSIYRVNQALGADAITGTGEDVRLNRAIVGRDIADFEAAIEAREWRQAVDSYGGPFLDGFYLPGAAEFDQWMENERSQHARTAAKALEALAVDARKTDRAAEAVEWWQRLAAMAPDDSRVAMELMRALESTGNRAGALRRARIHATVLRETLDAEPDRAVQLLAAEIARRNEGPIAASAPQSPAQVVDQRPLVVTRVSQVERVERVQEKAAATRQDRDITPQQPVRRWLRNSVVASIVIVLAIASSELTKRSVGHTSATIGLRGSIAVLPFQDLSESDSGAHFADGMSEELMYLLPRTPGLRVASPTSAFAYRDLKLDVREVARRLQVDWILEGSVRRSGNRLRVVAQLTDAKNGYQIWSESFDRTTTDAIATQEELATAIARRFASYAAARDGAPPLIGARF